MSDTTTTIELDPAKRPDYHPSVQHVLQFFAFEHLPPHLAEVARPFWVLAFDLADFLPHNPETTVALRKLLESKDAAVRAKLAAQ